MARTPKTQSKWINGVDSSVHPADLKDGQFAWGENIVNRGGVLQTRPGYKIVASIKGKNLQGLCLFTPRNSTSRLVAVVDGAAYQLEYPAYNPAPVPGVAMEPTAEFVVMEPTIQSAQLNEDSSIKLITPTPTLMFTDGVNRMNWWQGATGGSLDPAAPSYGAPPGCLWMEWVGSRLWTSKDNRVYSSDIVNPMAFSEQQYLAERGAFDLPDNCTGLLKTSDERGLLAFSQDDTTALKANIFDRTEWQTTSDFQKVIIPGIGCVAGRSIVNAYGETYWMTRSGLISLNAAMNSTQSSTIDVIDRAMMRSKRCLSPYLGGVAGCQFENYLLMSVPYADIYNRHTWALDKAVLNGRREQAWQGVWTGVRPVQWATGHIGGRDRCFFASYDISPFNDTHIHIWEAFDDRREDEGGEIKCQVEFAPLANDEMMAFKYAEFEVVEMLGDVHLQMFMGGSKGKWHSIGVAEMQAEKGSMGSHYQKTFTTTDTLRAFRPQSRTVKSEDWSSQTADTSCNPETDSIAGQDKAFGILLEWKGRMGVRENRIFVDPAGGPKDTKGECSPDESEQHNAVSERGETINELTP
jgi:hypothetical protein